MGRRAAMAGASKAVAIKLLGRNVVDDPVYRQMFLDEARLSMLLTNSNVVQVFDVGEVDGECFMVMEWVDGLNLSELTRKMAGEGEQLELLAIAYVVAEILSGLAYAHGLHHEGRQATIVHRDVSPHNVILSVSGEVKLADFGVARLAREETSGLHVKGKLRYMAPEQLRGRSREPTVDLYAVGAILHELLSGERFRQTRDEADLYSMVLSGEVPPLEVEAPAELGELRRRLLEPDPKRRIQTADEALELLYSWSGFRNASIDIAKVVRRWVGVRAPRSGIVSSPMPAAEERAASGPVSVSGAPTKRAEPVSAAHSDAHAEATAVDGPAMRIEGDSGPAHEHEREATESHTYVDSPHVPTTVLPAQAARTPMTFVVFGAVLLALAFGVFGMGFPLGWWGGDDGAVARAESVGESELAQAPEDEALAESGGAREDREATAGGETGAPTLDLPPDLTTGDGDGDAGGDTGEGGDGDGDGDGDDAGEAGEDETSGEGGTRKSRKEADRTPARVEFVAHDFLFVWVKVGGKELALEPIARVKLRPGRHRVYLRQKPDDDWKVAKTIKLEPGKRYKVRMTKPAGLRLDKLD